jgi:sterol 14-demethylase
MMGALFAAQQNSGINVAWILLHLASSPYWTAKARAEVEQVANKYHPQDAFSLAEKVAALPLTAWETEFPTLELCLRDSIRLHALGACFRQNISGRDVAISNTEAIPSQTFAVSEMVQRKSINSADSHR